MSTESQMRAGGWTVFIQAQHFRRNGSPDRNGGAHFFYGKYLQLQPGRYLVSIFVTKPRSDASRGAIIEALGWDKESAGIVLESSNVAISGPSEGTIFLFTFNVDRDRNVELRGWCDASASDLNFRGLTMQKLDDMPSNHPGHKPKAWLEARPRAWLEGEQLFWSEHTDGLPLALSFCDETGTPTRVHEIVVASTDPPLAMYGRPVWSVTLPYWLASSAHAILLSAGHNVYLVSNRMRGNEAPPPTLGDAVAADGLDHPADLTMAVAQLNRFYEETRKRVEAVETELHGRIAGALDEVDAFRRLMPTILNAVSTANAAAATVAKALPVRDQQPAST